MDLPFEWSTPLPLLISTLLLIIFVYQVITRASLSRSDASQSILKPKKQKKKKKKKTRHNISKKKCTPPKPRKIKSTPFIFRPNGIEPQNLKPSISTPFRTKAIASQNKAPLSSRFNFDSFQNTSNEYSMQCSSKCRAINRMIIALKYYDALNIIKDNDECNILKFMKFIESTYTNKRLLDDFIHIKCSHDANIERVESFVISKLNIAKCDIHHCISLSRQNRNRNLDRNHDDSKEDKEWIFIRDTFDNIHSYLFHTFDLGLRIKEKHLQNIKHDNYWKNILHNLRKNHKKLSTFCRYKSNKYQIDNKYHIDNESTWIDGLFEYISCHGIGYKEQSKLRCLINKEEYDSDSITNDVEDIVTINDSNMMSCLNYDRRKLAVLNGYTADGTLYSSSFSTGFAFNYWSYYSDTPFYIKPRYCSIREEVLNNKICQIRHNLFVDIVNKVQKLMQTIRMKLMSSRSDYLHCGIKQHSPMSFEHLIALVVYCDCTDLCTAFSSTFRRNKSFEALSSVKRRNAQYFHLSRLLRESVELFGEHKGYYINCDNKYSGITGPFYCGISFCCILPEFNIKLNGPTSTSKHIEVATRFGGDHGIIIELNNSDYVKCFNCSWISNFNAEDERLFFGGKHRMRVQSVQDIDTRLNFKLYFHALFYFDSMLNGADIDQTKDKINKMDIAICKRLIQHKLKIKKNEFHEYINNTFESFCNQKREVIINLHRIHKYFVHLKDFIFKYNSYLLNDIVFRLFNNLNIIIFDTTTDTMPYKEYSFSLSAAQQLLNSSYNVSNAQLMIKANWKLSHTFIVKEHSWIRTELEQRQPLDVKQYTITTNKIQNKFIQDSLILFRK